MAEVAMRLSRDAGVMRRFAEWRSMGRGDAGDWMALLDATQASVHVLALPAGCRIAVQGSNEATPFDGALLFEMDHIGLRGLPVIPRWVRPVLLAEAGAKVPRIAAVIVGAQ